VSSLLLGNTGVAWNAVPPLEMAKVVSVDDPTKRRQERLFPSAGKNL
jgi:hypothetical protein